MSTSWHSYPKVYNLGHRAINELLDGPVIIEEKVDGSQFSFGVFGGEIKVRSHNVEMRVDAPTNMFHEAVDYVKSVAPMLNDGWTYRGEYLRTPKHNTLAYGRIPRNHIILFDINDAEESYLNYRDKQLEAARIGIETVPLLATTDDARQHVTMDSLIALLDRESVLGAQKIEGVVIKNYSHFGPDGKVTMGKHVSESFKERHGHDWKVRNPGQSDIIEVIAGRLRTEARWNKAIQHLREDGKIQDSPTDIGVLLKEISTDAHAECQDEIKDALFKWAWPSIQRKIAAGFPEFYKQQLIAKQFAE